MNAPLKPVMERCPGLSYQEIIRRDGGSVADVLALQSNPPQSTEDIAFERYTSKAFFDLEMQKLWPKVWQYACREEHIPKVGDYFVYDIGRYSILVTRSEQGIKAFHNSCMHRGTKLKPSGSNAWSPSIQCPFHGWHWNLDGSIKEIPCRWDFPHVDDERARLRPILADSWNGCVFINMDRAAKPLTAYLEVVPEHWKRWDFRNWYVHQHVQKELSGNWKLAQEAFMEAYHTPLVHTAMTHVVSDINMQHDVLSDHVSRDLCAMASPSPTSRLGLTEQELLDRMLVADRSVVAEKRLVPEGKTARWVMAQQMRETMRTDFGLEYPEHTDAEMIDSIKYNVFPNLFVYAGVGLPLIQQFRPLGQDPDRCLYDQMILRPLPKDGSPPPVAEVVHLKEDESYTSVEGIDPFFASVLDQDTDIMRWQREGMHASEKGAETLSRYQESRIRHVHDTLDKYLKA
jgi:phenylpropionate dioxygenase-like ring-hydroxylating dioxygenase large terminal subunit